MRFVLLNTRSVEVTAIPYKHSAVRGAPMRMKKGIEMSVDPVYRTPELEEILAHAAQSKFDEMNALPDSCPELYGDARRLLQIVFDGESTVQEARAAAVTLVEIIAPDILAASLRGREKVGSCQGFASSSAATRCTCHERDSSYVCDHCYSKGFRGHMQR